MSRPDVAVHLAPLKVEDYLPGHPGYGRAFFVWFADNFCIGAVLQNPKDGLWASTAGNLLPLVGGLYTYHSPREALVREWGMLLAYARPDFAEIARGWGFDSYGPPGKRPKPPPGMSWPPPGTYLSARAKPLLAPIEERKPIVCPTCEKRFAAEGDLEKHTRAVHPKTRT